MLVKTKKGYIIKSETTGRKIGGPYKSKTQAQKRLAQIEYFKHRDATKQ